MSEVEVPKHAFELTVCVGGEDWEHTVRELERLTSHIRRHGPECNMSSGGAGTASHVYIETRDISPDAFEVELEAWSQQRQSERAAEKLMP